MRQNNISKTKLMAMANAELAADDWWTRMSKKEQEAYIEAHPRSKFANRKSKSAKVESSKFIPKGDRHVGVKGKRMTIPNHHITSPQTNSGDRDDDLDEDQVSYYRELLRAGKKLRPLDVVYSHESGKHHLVDGNHRLAAMEREGMKNIPVRVSNVVKKDQDAMVNIFDRWLGD